ncbi:DUF7691 family protein [Nocardia cyriacigeorgica]|uniref:DUF7691 family protein n=1 Tax=Nocardia cyriacigeorgica TaxID=135487 RepID=UPI001894639A|nr:hypothetical protein [Nocardia cyriacigeorgica]MBF6438286.1 hypothetical protein [Nocardia cyriacigeorgica]
MGYGVMPYAVETKYLNAPSTFTSDPEDFFDWMMQVHAHALDEAAIRTALRELFFAQEPTGSEGWAYGYALKVLWEQFGGWLPNGHWYPFRSHGFDAVGAALRALDIDFDPTDLIYSGAPVDLPPIDDFPSIGHLALAELKPLAESLNAADLTTIEDASLVDSLSELRGWTNTCVERDCDLVCFYH